MRVCLRFTALWCTHVQFKCAAVAVFFRICFASIAFSTYIPYVLRLKALHQRECERGYIRLYVMKDLTNLNLEKNMYSLRNL